MDFRLIVLAWLRGGKHRKAEQENGDGSKVLQRLYEEEKYTILGPRVAVVLVTVVVLVTSATPSQSWFGFNSSQLLLHACMSVKLVSNHQMDACITNAPMHSG